MDTHLITFKDQETNETKEINKWYLSKADKKLKLSFKKRTIEHQYKEYKQIHTGFIERGMSITKVFKLEEHKDSFSILVAVCRNDIICIEHIVYSLLQSEEFNNTAKYMELYIRKLLDLDNSNIKPKFKNEYEVLNSGVNKELIQLATPTRIKAFNDTIETIKTLKHIFKEDVAENYSSYEALINSLTTKINTIKAKQSIMGLH